MDQTNIAILKLLEKGLTLQRYEIEETLGLSEEVVHNALTYLERENMITHCVCGCRGIILLPRPRNKEQVLVWKTQDGNVVRLTHMSNEHLVNAVAWLLNEQNLDPEWRGDAWSDLSELYHGVQLGEWIQAMTEELCSRITNG